MTEKLPDGWTIDGEVLRCDAGSVWVDADGCVVNGSDYDIPVTVVAELLRLNGYTVTPAEGEPDIGGPIARRLAQLEGQVDEHAAQLAAQTNVTAAASPAWEAIDELRDRLNDLEEQHTRRLDVLAGRLDGVSPNIDRLADLLNALEERVDEHDSNLTELEDTAAGHCSSIHDLGARLADHVSAMSGVPSLLDGLDHTTHMHDGRLNDHESRIVELEPQPTHEPETIPAHEALTDVIAGATDVEVECSDGEQWVQLIYRDGEFDAGGEYFTPGHAYAYRRAP